MNSETIQSLISVIIPTMNSARTILKVMNALVHQSFKNFEIIVVDGGSKDNTVNIVKKFFSKNDAFAKRVLIISNKEYDNPAKAKNIGAKVAKGRILAFLDSDCVPPPDWLEKIYSFFSSFFNFTNYSRKYVKVGAIGATYLPPRQDIRDFNYILYKTMQNPLVSGGTAQVKRYRKVREVSNIPGGNLIIPKHIFESVGGFNEELYYCEDVDICYRIKLAGYKILYIPGLEVMHYKVFHKIRNYLRHIFKYGVGRGKAIITNIINLRLVHFLILIFIFYIALSFVMSLVHKTILSFLNIFSFFLFLYLLITLTNALVIAHSVLDDCHCNDIKLNFFDKVYYSVLLPFLIIVSTHFFYSLGLIAGLYSKKRLKNSILLTLLIGIIAFLIVLGLDMLLK